uniref:Ubiquitinyl hydrolase 1 n=1 Tax=Haemonchus contortus TaxID=6289 RepID=A0A7I4XZ25_HAECO
MDISTSPPHTKEQPSADGKEVLAKSVENKEQQPVKQGNSVTIKLFLNNPLRFIVDRHNEIEDAKARDEQMFRDFEEKLKRYGLSRDEVYWIDGTTSERRHIRNDSDLGELTHDAPVAHFYTAPSGDPSSEDHQKRQKKKRRSRRCSQESPHSFHCMLYRSGVPQFTITFKSKEELFQKYSQKLKELGIPLDSLYRLDSEELKVEPVRNADDVFSLCEQTFWAYLYKTMIQDDSSQMKTTTFKIQLYERPHFYISYKDKHDLFKQFKRKLREHGLSPSNIYLVEYNVCEPIQMNNADALMDAAATSMQMFNRDEKGCTSLDKREFVPYQDPCSRHDHHLERRTDSRHPSKGYYSNKCEHFCGTAFPEPFCPPRFPSACPCSAHVTCCSSCRCFYGYW